jgi:hypothetical protein
MLSLFLPRHATLGCFTAALGLVFAGTVAWAQDEKLPSGEKIMEKTIEGRGGREAFEKLKTRVLKGTIEVVGTGGPREGSRTRYEAAPNKRYSLVELAPDGKIESGTDGDVSWELSSSQGPRIVEGQEKAQRERDSTFNALLYWRELYEKVECVGKEQVDDRPCYKVVLTPKVGTPETMYFSTKNGFPVKTEMVRMTAQGDRQIQERLEDYREVDGVQLPFRVIRQVTTIGLPQNTTQTITYTWKSIEHNVDLPADRFDLPQEVKDLQANPGKKPAKPGAAKKPPG